MLFSFIIMRQFISIFCVLLICIGCSNTKKSAGKDSEAALNKVLNSYLNGVNTKSVDTVLSAYSKNHNKSVLSKEGLSELFTSVDKIKYSFEDVKITVKSENDAVANLIEKKEIKIGDRNITETNKNNIYFDKIEGKWGITKIELVLEDK